MIVHSNYIQHFHKYCVNCPSWVISRRFLGAKCKGKSSVITVIADIWLLNLSIASEILVQLVADCRQNWIVSCSDLITNFAFNFGFFFHCKHLILFDIVYDIVWNISVGRSIIITMLGGLQIFAAKILINFSVFSYFIGWEDARSSEKNELH